MKRKAFILFLIAGLTLMSFPWYWAFAVSYLTTDPINTPFGFPKCYDLLHHFLEAGWQAGILPTHTIYVYPPLTAKFFIPLGHAPYWVWHSTWVTLNVCLWAGLYLLWRKYFSGPFCFQERFVFFLFPAAIDGLRLGQNSIISTFLLFLCALALKQNRPFVAGLLIGTIFYKPQLVLPITAIFVILGNYRAVFGSVVGSIAWTALGLLVCGWESYHKWILFIQSDPSAVFNNFANTSIFGFFRDAIARGWPKEIKILWLLLLALLWGGTWLWVRKSVFMNQLTLWERFFLLIPLITITPPYFGMYDWLLCLPALMLLTRYIVQQPGQHLSKMALVTLLLPGVIYALVFLVIAEKLPLLFLPVLVWLFLVLCLTQKLSRSQPVSVS